MSAETQAVLDQIKNQAFREFFLILLVSTIITVIVWLREALTPQEGAKVARFLIIIFCFVVAFLHLVAGDPDILALVLALPAASLVFTW